jgi:hypothetical protein
VEQVVDLGSESPVAVHNPLVAVVDQLDYNPCLADPVEAFEVDPASTLCFDFVDSASMSRFESKFDGFTNGLLAEEHLEQFFKFQRATVPGATDQLVRLHSQLNQFADSYENKGSRFHGWAMDKIGPILQHLDQASLQTTAPARNQSFQAALALWRAAIADYRATFCKATQAELNTLLQTPCPDINTVRNLVIKFRALYSLGNTHAVPPEDSTVRLFLNKLRCNPVLANVGNGLLNALQALPPLPQGAAVNGGNYTFTNVSNELERMALEFDTDAAAFLHAGGSVFGLPAPLLAPVANGPFTVPQLPAANTILSNTSASGPSLAHLDDHQRAQVMAICDPNGMCTTHRMLHTWSACPSRQPPESRVNAAITTSNCPDQSGICSTPSTEVQAHLGRWFAAQQSALNSLSSKLDSLLHCHHQGSQGRTTLPHAEGQQ